MATKFLDVVFDKWAGKNVLAHKRGVTLIHLFNEVWRTGRLNEKNGKPAHLVIYSPQDKEYHVYGREAKNLMSDYSGKSDPAKVKIYILTSILDQRENWSWDLTEKPISGSVYVIVYNNGTIKKIVSTGEWAPEVIQRQRLYAPETIHPVAYKIK